MAENGKIRNHYRRTAHLMLRMAYRNLVIDDNWVEKAAQQMCVESFGIEKTKEIFQI